LKGDKLWTQTLARKQQFLQLKNVAIIYHYSYHNRRL